MKQAVKKAAKVPQDEIEVFDDFDQLDEQWFEARMGLPTASNFDAVMAKGADENPSRTRQKLLYLLAAEIIHGQPMTTFSNNAMARGIEQEPKLLAQYAWRKEVTVDRVAFVRRTVRRPLATSFVVGCSPDGLIGKDGGVEMKSMQPDLIVQLLHGAKVPMVHRAQVQGNLWVTGRKWWDLAFGYEGFPLMPIYTFQRDDSYIAQLDAACEVFCRDLDDLVKQIKRKGGIT